MSQGDLLGGSSLRAVLRGYLLVGLVAIVALIGLFTVRITREMDAQAELVTRLVGQFLAETLTSGAPADEMLRRMGPIRDSIRDVDFPFVITDAEGHPFLWNSHQTGVPMPDDLELADLLDVDLDEPADERTRRLLALVARYDAEREPVTVSVPGRDEVLLRVHYGRSRLSRRLGALPLLEAALILAFMGVAFLAFRSMKRSEQRRLWVGMAKETAHQMGTPLTSLNGWLALLSDRDSRREDGPDEMQIVGEIQSDVDRLAKVSARFSQIGSHTRLTEGSVEQVLRRVCAYFRRRLPHLGTQVEIVEDLEALPPIPLAEELLDWAIENLVKNALDASDKPQGQVTRACAGTSRRRRCKDRGRRQRSWDGRWRPAPGLRHGVHDEGARLGDGAGPRAAHRRRGPRWAHPRRPQRPGRGDDDGDRTPRPPFRVDCAIFLGSPPVASGET